MNGYRTYSGAEGKPEAQRSAVSGTAGSTVVWLFTDEQGTVDVRTNALTGATTQQYRNPFGAPLSGTASQWADTKGFLNKPVASTVGLTTIGARTYDPVLGKFLSVDPVIDTNLPQQNTGYAYAGNNPITYSDPSGLRFYLSGEDGRINRMGDHATKANPAAERATLPSWYPVPSPMPGPKPVPFTSKDLVERQRTYLAENYPEQLNLMIEARVYDGLAEKLNASINSEMETLMAKAGADCKVAPNGLNVCSAPDWIFGGGTTFGHYFITNWDIDTAIDNIDLMDHELDHTYQWAGFGSDYPALYARFAAESLHYGFGTGCGNYFEAQAGLGHGGYKC